AEASEWQGFSAPAGRRFAAGLDLYPQADSYLYPPFGAFCAIPFTWLAPAPARLAWYAVNVLALIALCWTAWQIAGGGALQGARASRSEQIIWWLGLACGVRYAPDGLAHQQTDVVIGALLMSGCWALFRSRPLVAATLLGIAAGVKCTPLLWCGYLLWRGCWLAALWLVAVALGVNLLPDL